MSTLLVFIAVFTLTLVPALRYRARVRAVARPAGLLDELPDILDGLSLCSEAGMDVMQALEQFVVPRKEEPLPAELYTVVQEVRAGSTRAEAWRHFADRVGHEDVRMLVATLLQAEVMGVGPARLLGNQATAIRDRRFRHAERCAGEAPVKLLLPMVFVFLSVFVVLFGAVFLSFHSGSF